MSVLNPGLYHRLKNKFGTVKIANDGQEMIAESFIHPITGKPHFDFAQRGEQYRICCPYCTDTRFRLYISHRWGTKDDLGRKLTFLAKCFNEDCLADSRNRSDLVDELEALHGGLETERIRRGTKTSEAAAEKSWPGKVIGLDQLSEQHKARHYVTSRGFDPDKLGRRYGVHYCLDIVGSKSINGCLYALGPRHWLVGHQQAPK